MAAVPYLSEWSFGGAGFAHSLKRTALFTEEKRRPFLGPEAVLLQVFEDSALLQSSLRLSELWPSQGLSAQQPLVSSLGHVVHFITESVALAQQWLVSSHVHVVNFIT